ncbi:hypothetical protein EET67_22230 [Pseudaminobacter arsenicus]|uniref:Uncharacterized protein n=1 Tax=Borborobacter arsenicus TaxID=1851146 RepID=A0A432V077_9HYPH|nr:hypothetical protein [Pseudaminobacter arsenicus]RUM95607.1 hypothetical protein EET67_22230 [Pseudaminobacter arsenicus]
MTYRQALRVSESGLDPLAALRQPITVLVGSDESASGALQRIGLDSVFDLATSPLFAFANALSKSIDGSFKSALNSLRLVPGGLASEDAPQDLTDFAHADLTVLRSLSVEEAEALKSSLHAESIADLGRWPPYHGALAILSAVNGRELGGEEEETLKLVPTLGDYPTERRYYTTMLMDHVSVANPTSLGEAGAIDISPALDATFGFSAPAIGARVTFEQSWFAQGMALGNLLHSVALAPGESTRIAVETWDRRDTGRGSEDISETERLTNVTTHNRAINEVQEAVANEVQTGFSRTHSEATTASGGVGFGLGLGPLTIGGSGSAGTTTTDANSFSTSAGSRSIGATMSQQVSDATQQAASTVRGRRASIIKEISQSEQQQVSTRILANYNHMHALTVQYYEVVELYRVISRLHEVERCLFIPMKLTEFDEKVIEKYRSVLADAALSRRARELLATEFGMVNLTSTRSIRPFVTGFAATTAVMARVAAATTGDEGETAATERPIAPQITSWSREELRVASRLTATPLIRPGSSSILLPREASLETLTFTSSEGGPQIAAISFRLQSDNNVDLARTSLGWDVPGEVSVGNLLEIIVTTGQADRRLSGGLSLGLVYRGASFPVTIPVEASAGASTVVAKIGDTGAGPELVEHLRANRLHYNQAVWRSLDSATVALLLSRFEFEGMPVANLIDPRPIQVAGNYLVFRMPAFTVRAGQPRGSAEEGEAAETEARQNWARWLQRRGLVFGPATSNEELIPVPTGGVFAEAVLGRSNAAEKLDATRFWNWQDSPIPLQPPEVAAISMQSRAQSMDVTPGQLGQPVLNIVNPTNLPDPAGLGAAFAALQNGNMFRDMSSLAATIGLATSSVGEATSAAADSGKLAAANLAVAAQKEIEKDRIAAQVALAMMGKPSVSGGTPKNISEMGSLLNAGERRDRARQSNGGAAGSGAIGANMSPTGGGSGAGGGVLGSQPWTGTRPSESGDDYDLAYRRALYGEIGGPLASIIPTGGTGGAASPSGPYFNLGGSVPGPLEWPTIDFPAPNEFASIFRDHYNERISRGFFRGATEVLGADAIGAAFASPEEIEGDLRNGALSIVNNRFTLVNNANGREQLLSAMNCIALASSYDAAKAANPIIAGGGLAPSASINVPFDVVYVAKRLGIALAWYDEMIRTAVTQEAARISRAKTAWETEAGIVFNIATLPVPPAFSVPVGTGLGMLVSGLSQRFDREFDKYQTVINELKQAYGRLANYFLVTTLTAMIPDGQLNSNVRALISQFEANVLLGADQESKFLRGQMV